jgi:hypothetical protein
MATFFVGPRVTDDPPVPESDLRYGPSSYRSNPLGWALMRHYKSRVSGCNVYLMDDNTYCVDPTPDGWPNTAPIVVSPTTGEFPRALPIQPWPPVPPDYVTNGEIASAVYDTHRWSYPPDNPSVDGTGGHFVVKVYYGGGQQNALTADEIANFTAQSWDGYLVEEV